MILCFIDIKAVSVTNSFDYDDDDDEDYCKVKGRYDQAATQILLPRCLSKWSSTSPRPVWNSNLSEMTIGFSELSKKIKLGKKKIFVSSTYLELICNVPLKSEWNRLKLEPVKIRWKDLDWLNGAGGNGHIHLIKTEIEQRSTCDEDVEDIWCFKMPCLGW